MNLGNKSSLSSLHSGPEPDVLVQKCQEWIEATTGDVFQHDFRKSLESGITLCEFIGKLKPGCKPRYSKLPTHHAFVDNINQFLRVCKDQFGLKGDQLFEATDLEDPSKRRGSTVALWDQDAENRKLRNVVGTLYWLGCKVDKVPGYGGPRLDLSAFKDFMKHTGNVFESVRDRRKESNSSLQIEVSSKTSPVLMPITEIPHTTSTTSKPVTEVPRFSPTASKPVTEVPRFSPTASKPVTEVPRFSPTASKPVTEVPRFSPTASKPVTEVPRFSPTASKPVTEVPRFSPTASKPVTEVPRSTPTPPLTASSSSSRTRTPTPSLTSSAAKTVVDTEVLTVPMRSTERGSFGCQVTGGSDSHIPPTIDMIVPGSPADQNDLRRGDVILSVNGESTHSLLHSEVVSLMKAAGSNGSIVLGIQRKVEVTRVITPTPEPAPRTTPPPTQESEHPSNNSNIKENPSHQVKLSVNQRIVPTPPPVVGGNKKPVPVSDQVKKGSGPVRISINQRVVDVHKDKPTKEGGDENGLSEFDAIMAELATDLIELKQPLREKKPKTPVETTITNEGTGKVLVTIKKKGSTAPTGGETSQRDREPISVDPIEQSFVDPVHAKNTRGLDTDIALLEAEISRLTEHAETRRDEELLNKPGWDRKASNDESVPRTAETRFKASLNQPVQVQAAEEDHKRKKDDQKQKLFSMLAQSTQLPPRVDSPKSTSPPPTTSVPPSVTAGSNWSHSPATMQDLANREAFLKERMKEQRKAREDEWKRLEEEHHSLERGRKVDYSSNSLKKIEEQRNQMWKEAIMQQGDQNTRDSVQEVSEELKRMLEEADKKERLEEKRLQEEQRRILYEQQRREVEQRKQAEAEERLAELFHSEQERKRQESARQKMEKEAAWIIKLEQEKSAEQKRKYEMESAFQMNKQRLTEEESKAKELAEAKRRDKETAWIRDLEEMKSKQVAARMQTQTRPLPSPPPPEYDEDARRKAEALKRFDELIAQEEAKEKEKQKLQSSSANPPVPRSPAVTRSSFSRNHQPYSSSLSKSLGEIQHAGHQQTQSPKKAVVADVHQFISPSHRTASWRDPSRSPKAKHQSPKVGYRHSFHSSQPVSNVCAICSIPLGREPSMTVAETGLKYHARCLKCTVCQTKLATGLTSVGICLREGKPHCKYCISTNAGVLATEC